MSEAELIGRDEEQELLQEFYKPKRSEFIALYGRRRVGKTYLIRQFFNPLKVKFFNTTGIKNAPLGEQIGNFTKEISRLFYNNAPLTPCKNWNDTFGLLTSAIDTLPKNSKVVLFLDEFPWMVTRRSRLLESLDYYWNRHWSDNDKVKLIICGSSAAWIIRKIINNRAGLHNRITRKILLKPFTLSETKKFLFSKGIKLNNKQILQIYMMMGGVPYYLSQVPKGMTSNQIIDLLAFSEKAFFVEEFDNLFSSLFDDYEEYIEIVRLIASVRQGIGKTEILTRLDKSQSGGQGLEKLEDLEKSGFIKSYNTHFNKKKGVYYRLIDEYVIFYFNWIEPLKLTLQYDAATKGSFIEMQSSPKWYAWLGYAFEAVCYKNLGLIREKLSVTASTIANTWRFVPKKGETGDGAQIDLLFDRMDDAITICEIKYTDNPFIIDKEYAKKLANKRGVFIKKTGTQKQIFIAMIAANGVKENLYFDDLIDGVVTLDDFFVE